MPLPCFLVVGAAKCGTTSLFHSLNQSPDIFIPSRKEGRFFLHMPGDFQSKASGYPKSWMVQHVINKLGPVRRAVSPLLEKTIGERNTIRFRNYLRSLNITKVPVEGEARARLIKYFEPDIKELRRVLGRDMDIWLE